MDTLEKDLHFLAEELGARLPQTDAEKRAAEYVTNRLSSSLDEAHGIDFDAIGNYRLFFAAYFAEFIVVGLMALWWPTPAFFYGLVIFLVYIAEFMGYPILSSFLPHYASSSAMGQSKTHDAACTIVFTAFLDTSDNPFSRIEARFAKYYLHYGIILCMLFVLVTCGIDALGAFRGQVNPYTEGMRWIGIGLFTLIAAAGFLRALFINQNRGANSNASGVTALLHLADLLQENPIKNSVVLFYAAGSHHANMEGMRTLLTENPHMAENTYVINIESIGAGQLCYTKTEGMLQQMPCDPELLAAAKMHSKKFHALPTTLNNRCSNAYLPLIHNIPALSILRLGKDGLPAHFGKSSDICKNIDLEAVRDAALFAECIGREVVKRHIKIPGFDEND
ncbi:MAG: M28 family peptidase [Candidatus Hydrogenedentes bacterium]|nr:M28 family peptidase [Candidatus Hydrogenedentota bacterium]